MRTIQKLLVPLDGSEVSQRAVPWAKAAAGGDAEILLMEVMPVASSVRSIGGEVIGSAEVIQEGYRQIAEQHLEEAIGRWFDSRERVSTQLAAGDPGEQILAMALAQGADLIVMSSHGRGTVGRFVSGSVADRVVRHSPVPVMIVGPEGEMPERPSIQRIIAPVDDTAISIAALPVSGALSLRTGAPVTVMHVIVPTTDISMTYPAMIGTLPPSAYDMAQERMTIEAHDLVDRAVQVLKDAGVKATSEVYSGNPADSIMGVLKPGDVIVLSSHARQGLARWVLGSTATKLVRNGQAPVVVVTRESIERASSGS